jgi:hypothetical protein
MHIEANLGYKNAGNGVKLPEYLVRMSHHDAMALGANRFEVGEVLNVVGCLANIEIHIRTLNKITTDLQRDNARDIALKLVHAVLDKSPTSKIEELAQLYFMGCR